MIKIFFLYIFQYECEENFYTLDMKKQENKIEQERKDRKNIKEKKR